MEQIMSNSAVTEAQKANDLIQSARGEIKITNATVACYSWPRVQPITNGLHTYVNVNIAITKIETDIGVTGYGIGRDNVGENAMRKQFLAKMIGKDPTMTEAVWKEFWIPKLYGRRGQETKALSSIDMALWDIKGKLAGLPIWRLLGGYRNRIPTYVAGGYYSKGKGTRDLQAEMEGHVKNNARAVKMKIGAVEIAEDVERIKAVREVLGPDIKLMIDANCAYSYSDAIRLAKRVEEYDIYWFEEAVQPDDYEGFIKLSRATSIPLATGENEYTKHGFRDLIATQAIAFLQPDARYMGGVTEFMKVAGMAQAHGLNICPHGDQQAHIQLLGAIPNGHMLEFGAKELNPMAGQVYKYSADLNEDGTVTIPDVPGMASDPNEAALEKYRVA
jgi:L-alanine-DL-glutamate epimerase-like enolase superfamily enzyme